MNPGDELCAGSSRTSRVRVPGSLQNHGTSDPPADTSAKKHGLVNAVISVALILYRSESRFRMVTDAIPNGPSAHCEFRPRPRSLILSSTRRLGDSKHGHSSYGSVLERCVAPLSGVHIPIGIHRKYFLTDRHGLQIRSLK